MKSENVMFASSLTPSTGLNENIQNPTSVRPPHAFSIWIWVKRYELEKKKGTHTENE